MSTTTQIDNFKGSDGSVDWVRYRTAQVANGEYCSKCRGLAAYFNPPGHPTLCSDCRGLKEVTGEEVTHDDFIRCPKCGHQDKISEWDGCDDGDVMYGDGDHAVSCPECEHEYVITTRASYSYTSPAMIKTEESK